MYQINWPRAICLPFLFVKRFSILFLHQHNLTKIRYGPCSSEFSFYFCLVECKLDEIEPECILLHTKHFAKSWALIVHFVLMINNKLKV